MPWSESVIEQFSLLDLLTTDESDFYGPFNTLLFELFPPSQHYQISPQYKRVAGSLDFTVLYIVHKRKVPIFFISIKTFLALDNLSSRAKADDQMRERFLEFSSGSIPTLKLFGISAMGTRFSVYELTTANRQLQPPRINPDVNYLIDRAPKDRWNHDIMDEAGEARLKEVVAEVKEMASNLN